MTKKTYHDTTNRREEPRRRVFTVTRINSTIKSYEVEAFTPEQAATKLRMLHKHRKLPPATEELKEDVIFDVEEVSPKKTVVTKTLEETK